MDNLAHSLVGAAIGRAVAGHRVPRAALLGVVSANAPDWAELFTGWPWPGAGYLAEHRGITHAFAGVAIEILALLAVAGGAWWWWHQRDAARTPPVAWGSLALLVVASVASHPFMDWQGSYGLRPFLPWSDRWYYGDFVAIVDPLYWMLPLVALAWGSNRHWRPLAGYALVGVPASALVLTHGLPAPWLKGAWVGLIVIGGIGWIAHWFGVVHRRQAAGYALAALALYAGAQGVASLRAKRDARAAAVARFGPDATWAALTVVGRPFTWTPMFANSDSIAAPGWAGPRHLERPEVRRALAQSRDGRAIRRFARFLVAHVDSGARPPVVTLRDARYARYGGDSWATVVVPSE